MPLALLILLTALLAGCGTPYGKAGLTGGARERQLATDSYLVRAGINGFSAPGLLKPLVVKRAREVGKERGYASFAMDAIDLDYDNRGMGYGAEVLVRYSKAPLAQLRGVTYAVDAPDPYRPSIENVDPSKYAKLQGSRVKQGIIDSTSAVPVFFDAVAASGSHSTSVAYLEPGRHRFFVHYWIVRGAGFSNPIIGFTEMDRVFEAGKSYVVAARYDEGTLGVWVEDETTKKRIGEVQVVPRASR